jgi:hypothetical protein
MATAADPQLPDTQSWCLYLSGLPWVTRVEESYMHAQLAEGGGEGSESIAGRVSIWENGLGAGGAG